MSSTRAIIPRFLLPLQGPLWRGIRIPLSHNIRIRFASTGPDKPVVLEKPLKFNPPSHGSRLKRGSMPKHYGPPLSAEEVAAQNQKHYPGVMAPEGSWQHWFWHSRALHLFITLGTLFGLAICTFFMNYAFNSPFKDLVPPISDLWTQPLAFFQQWKTVIVLHEQEKGRRAYESRMRHVDDVAKRQYYMKMHNIETKDPVAMMLGRGKEKTEEELEAVVMGRDPPKAEAPEPRKKWFGVF
ncbi:hypothetical protein S7711_02077 [Stachybotrys chartarum IBT 7711]|uniref:Uncharacterized protein n=1 Tax=Stachybotrys chartarum (strain CBS 109288 / IBT 7711) TaxID=1280523 RepID=A0A084AW63_STACB|nr:hypothetical protein S7711_02077 [Stachybotrys chartarum IBT 7711]KFA53306.1 hypothetical protein S40293_04662 [Stachybotrys chartarum IBT 40293]KFA78969.1 hypothetical protein S40288_00558 [Stachybotrys chartarum IBT 40288]